MYHSKGRRVVELGVLAAHLQKGCKKCGAVLHLWDCIQERHYGLGSILYIKCTICSYISNIPIGKRHEKNIWDMNTKLGAGIANSGIGFSVLQMLFASLNIPGVAAGTVKKRDREAGKAIESVAQKSCNDALDEELKMNDGKVEIRVAADAGWQTRSSGRKYNSYSGHSVLIGDKSGKILRYDYRCRKCRLCENAKRKGIQPIDHDCRKNWDGSAKAMEPDMIVGMLKDLEKENIHPHELVMDDDSTAISRARKKCDQTITKFSDRNHLKKTFSNKLYDLQRVKKYQQLRGKTITHLKKCFSYVLAQHQKKPEELKKSLLCIIPHMYGDHLACPSWCKYKRNPANYIPRNLPYSRYLTCLELKKDLEAIIQTYAQQAEKLSDLGSTQACESFNHIVASKHPKNLYLSGSESTSFRIAAAVAQKNIGKSYIQELGQ
ncbi:uncharacterized protein LOC133201777 [Saccostrea echinata]|uniref:uncharacterized protein LOC133201777 n=1 Tax=Saccostrea echinata TaxID=191078 RepID=UPI002A8412B2|nr:uncharacterized protein LOC133201777 [Saccostrea echinata]